MFTIGLIVSSSDTDQVKAAGKDYVNTKPVWPVCVCVATMLQKQRTQNLFEKFSYSFNT